MGNTIHDYDKSYYINYPDRMISDRGIRYTTAGLQVASHLGFNFIKSDKHEFMGRLGVVVRYQSSSSSNSIDIIQPHQSKLDYPVDVLYYNTPARTVAIGPSFQLAYNYTILQKYSIGVLAGLQIDTNSDNLSYLNLTFGRRF